MGLTSSESKSCAWAAMVSFSSSIVYESLLATIITLSVGLWTWMEARYGSLIAQFARES